MYTAVLPPLCIFLASLAVCSALQVPKTRCYECNFSPSGFVLGADGWKEEGMAAGYQRCALKQQEDQDSVDQWYCRSGKCFLRKDSNGLVYRGCADESFLPMGVSTHMHCHHNGPGQSLWWFCEGNLCNGGPVGENLHCDSPQEPEITIYDEVKDDTGSDDIVDEVAPEREVKESEGENAINDGRQLGIQPLNQANQVQYQAKQTINSKKDTNNGVIQYETSFMQRPEDTQPEGKEGPGQGRSRYPADAVYVDIPSSEFIDLQEYEVQGQDKDKYVQDSGQREYYDMADNRHQLLAGLCDGKCYGNPSGLFPDPQYINYFVQCAMGQVNGQQCQCCVAYTRQCPPGTTKFDYVTKVCV